LAAARSRRQSFNLREHLIAYLMVAPPVPFLGMIIIYPALKAIGDTLTAAARLRKYPMTSPWYVNWRR